MAGSSTPTGLESRRWWSEQTYAAQQPQWQQHRDYRSCCAALASSPALVTKREILELRSALAAVGAGDAQLMQAGDCAESFYETDEAHIQAKLTLLHQLADQLAAGTGQKVLRVGRLGGQFAKPRTSALEHVVGTPLPVFRGHMVNSEEPSLDSRAHDPRRMVTAYAASAEVLGHVRADRAARAASAGRGLIDGPWSSHDALVIDYEANLVRSEQDMRFLGSTHLPWIGDRTRQPDAAHVQLLSGVANPVACKVGPSATIADLSELCARLDPDRMPGRLTLIVRLGKNAIAERLPSIVAAVRSQGHPVVWLSDPMHGNTLRVGNANGNGNGHGNGHGDGNGNGEGNGNGMKTRLLADIIDEAAEFQRILRRSKAHLGGLHLEVAAGDVTECLGGAVRDTDHLLSRYTTLCDPRLNPDQAAELVRSWCQGM
jgi:3-deoxy-7-phosphoheptulonate synthase